MFRSILLVDDSEDDVFFFKTAAKKKGWSQPIVVATNGREAVEILRRYVDGDTQPAPFGLVLLDIKMPFMSGLEVLEWMRSQSVLRFLPVVMLTSSEQEADIEAAYRLGAASFIVKPSNPDELGDLLRVIDEYWFRRNRLPAVVFGRESKASS